MVGLHLGRSLGRREVSRVHVRGQDWGRWEKLVRVQGWSTGEPNAGDGMEAWIGKQRFRKRAARPTKRV